MLPVDVPVQCRVCVLDSGHQIGRGPDGFPPLLNGVCYLDREAVGIERARSADGSEAESAGNFVIQNDDIGSRGGSVRVARRDWVPIERAARGLVGSGKNCSWQGRLSLFQGAGEPASPVRTMRHLDFLSENSSHEDIHRCAPVCSLACHLAPGRCIVGPAECAAPYGVRKDPVGEDAFDYPGSVVVVRVGPCSDHRRERR